MLSWLKRDGKPGKLISYVNDMIRKERCVWKTCD